MHYHDLKNSRITNNNNSLNQDYGTMKQSRVNEEKYYDPFIQKPVAKQPSHALSAHKKYNSMNQPLNNNIENNHKQSLPLLPQLKQNQYSVELDNLHNVYATPLRHMQKKGGQLIVNHYGKKVMLTKGQPDYLRFRELPHYQIPQKSQDLQTFMQQKQQEAYENDKIQIAIRFDSIQNFPEQLDQFKISFILQDKKGLIYDSGSTNIYTINNPELTHLGERVTTVQQWLDPTTYLYIEISAKDSIRKSWFEIWTIIPIIENQQQNNGLFKLMFYKMQDNSEEFFSSAFEAIKGVRLNLRVSQMFDSDIDSDFKKFNTNKYVIPQIQLRKPIKIKENSSQIIDKDQLQDQNEQKKKKNFNVDKLMGHIDSIKKIREKAYDSNSNIYNVKANIPAIQAPFEQEKYKHIYDLIDKKKEGGGGSTKNNSSAVNNIQTRDALLEYQYNNNSNMGMHNQSYKEKQHVSKYDSKHNQYIGTQIPKINVQQRVGNHILDNSSNINNQRPQAQTQNQQQQQEQPQQNANNTVNKV